MGAGYFFDRKGKMHPFKYSMISLSLVICYADIIITRWAWALLSNLVAFFLIVVWAGLTAFLSHRYKKKFFYVVLEIGLVLTSFIASVLIQYTLFGLILMLVMIMMYALAFIGYFYEFKESSVIFPVSFTGMTLALTLSLLLPGKETVYFFAEQVVLLLSIFAVVFFYPYFVSIKHKVACVVSKIVIIGVFPIFLYIVLEHEAWITGEEIWKIAAAVLAFAYVTLITFKEENSWEIIIPAYLHMLFAACKISELLGCGLFGFAVLAVFLYLVDWNKEQKKWKIPFILTDILALIGFLKMTSYWNGNVIFPYLYGGYMLLFNGLLLCIQIKKKGDWYIQLSTGILLLVLYQQGSMFADAVPSCETFFIILGLAVIVLLFQSISFLRYIRMQVSEDIFTWISSLIVNGMLMENLDFNDPLALSLLAMLLLIHLGGFFCLLVRYEKKHFFIDAVFALVATYDLLCLFECLPFSKYAVLLSLMMLLIAALFVMVGFYIKRKGFRMYGLVLLLISVIKMTVFDIAGSDSMIKVLSLIIGGIICLIISFFYNKMEKVLKETDTEGRVEETEEEEC